MPVATRSRRGACEMSRCTRADACPFFTSQLSEMPATADLYRAKYCSAEWARCARFRVLGALGSAAVPDDLTPNDQRKANAILREAGQ